MKWFQVDLVTSCMFHSQLPNAVVGNEPLLGFEKLSAWGLGFGVLGLGFGV